MKVPVFLGSTMELIAIVRMEDDNLRDIVKHGGYISFCEYPSLRAPVDLTGPTQDTVRRMDFKGYPIRSNTATTFYLLVDRHDDLRFFKGRQIWPRSRPDRSKRSKAERKYRREAGQAPLIPIEQMRRRHRQP